MLDPFTPETCIPQSHMVRLEMPPLTNPVAGFFRSIPTPWVAATIGVAGLLVAAAAVYAMTRKRSAVPNASRWLRTGPEAALVLMPPAIPSYLAYRYAVSRMDPEDAAVAESWRDWMPGSEWDEDDL